MLDLSVYHGKNTIASLWDSFYKNVNHDQIFLYNYDEEKKPQTFTYKELNAKAHCFAAYLLKIGVKKSEKVLIISQNNPNFYIVDLACNLLGATSLCLPFFIEEDKLYSVISEFRPKLCYIDQYETFQKYPKTLQNYCEWIVIHEQDYQKISENESIVLIENTIELGKIFWRENQSLINEQKNAVQENDILFYITPKHTITNKEFIINLKKLISNYSYNKRNTEMRILISSLPSHILSKYTFYLGLFRYFLIYLCQKQRLTHKFIKENKIHHWVISEELLAKSKEWFNQKGWSRNFAIQKQKNRLEYKIQNKNLPFGLKIQSNLSTFQRKLLRLQWGNLNFLHVPENELSLEDILNWNSIHIPILSYQIGWNGNFIKQNLIDLNKSIQIPDADSNKLYSENFFNE